MILRIEIYERNNLILVIKQIKFIHNLMGICLTCTQKININKQPQIVQPKQQQFIKQGVQLQIKVLSPSQQIDFITNKNTAYQTSITQNHRTDSFSLSTKKKISVNYSKLEKHAKNEMIVYQPSEARTSVINRLEENDPNLSFFKGIPRNWGSYTQKSNHVLQQNDKTAESKKQNDKTAESKKQNETIQHQYAFKKI